MSMCMLFKMTSLYSFFDNLTFRGHCQRARNYSAVSPTDWSNVRDKSFHRNCSTRRRRVVHWKSSVYYRWSCSSRDQSPAARRSPANNKHVQHTAAVGWFYETDVVASFQAACGTLRGASLRVFGRTTPPLCRGGVFTAWTKDWME